MQIAEAAMPLCGIPYRKRCARKTTPHTRLAEPRRDRLQYEVCTRSYQKHRNEEEGRIVAFVTEVRP